MDGVIDLGSLDWTQGTGGGGQIYYWTSKPSDMVAGDIGQKANIYLDGYTVYPYANAVDGNKRTAATISYGGRICVSNNSYTSTSEFKSAMRGVHLYYQITTSQDSYNEYKLPELDNCTLCPPNTYKDFVGNEPCTPCPNGLMSPAGATNIDECVRIMHIGDKIYPLNSVKKTSPALHIRDENGHVWYGNLYSQDQASD